MSQATLAWAALKNMLRAAAHGMKMQTDRTNGDVLTKNVLHAVLLLSPI